MEVIRQDIDQHNAFLRVEIVPSDYQPKVKSELEKLRKKAHLPGFRKGMVPFSLIQKQYGRSVLYEEINHLINHSISDFIQTNDIQILGQPIPKENTSLVGDLAHPDIFHCEFHIGLMPEFDLQVPINDKHDYYRVKVDQQLIDRQVSDLRRRYGKMIIPEQTTVQSMSTGTLVQLNDDGTVTEGGIFKPFSLLTDTIEDPDVQKIFIGCKVNEPIVFDARKVDRVKEIVLSEMNLSDQEWEEKERMFQLTLDRIFDVEPAELDTSFFDRLFGADQITTQEAFYQRIAEDLKNIFENRSEDLFLSYFHKLMLENTDIPLPHDFLKRWIPLNEPKGEHQQPLTPERYENIIKAIKWDIIRYKLLKDNQLTVQENELLDRAIERANDLFQQQGVANPSREAIQDEVSRMLQDEQERQQIMSQLSDKKLMRYLKDSLQFNEVELPYEEFVELTDQIR